MSWARVRFAINCTVSPTIGVSRGECGGADLANIVRARLGVEAFVGLDGEVVPDHRLEKHACQLGSWGSTGIEEGKPTISSLVNSCHNQPVSRRIDK